MGVRAGIYKGCASCIFYKIHVGYTRCAWAVGTVEFYRIIDRICWSCPFSLTYHVCFGILEPNLLGLKFFPLKLIVVGLGNLRGLDDCSFDRGN
jgi:hypothetical protein